LETNHEEQKTKLEHLSYSGIKDWDFCPFFFKLTRVDGIAGFEGNLHTAFGTAVHGVLEGTLLEDVLDVEEGKRFDKDARFKELFAHEISGLPEEEKLLIKNDKSTIKLYKDMLSQGCLLSKEGIPALRREFGDFQLIETEDLLYESIGELHSSGKFKFKGFVDLIIKTADGKYHVIDWKTTTWGWNQKRKSEPITTYQLTLYKHFACLKHGLDPENTETHFALLKRAPPKGKDAVEFLRVTSGPTKTKNALNLLKEAVYSVDKEIFVKKKVNCQQCKFLRRYSNKLHASTLAENWQVFFCLLWWCRQAPRLQTTKDRRVG
jgi:hypothetical protein